MNTPQHLTTRLAALCFFVSLCSPAFSAAQEKQGEATGNVKLDISVRYAADAPGPQTAHWWSAIDATFVYWFQDQGYAYCLATYDSALPYVKPKHQWQGPEDWSNHNGTQPSAHTPGAPISRVKISVWDSAGNEHLLVTNEGGWATMCGKIREA